jgi:hypothetical protein
LIEQAGYQQYAANQSSQYARYAEHKERQACSGVPGNQLPKCLAEARISTELDKRSYEHDQADLIAQRKAALWAEMMGLAALLGMGLSIVGVVLVYVTFRATREGNEIQKRIGEAQTRAYISVIQATAFLSQDKVPHFGFVIKNSGQSPALKMRLRIEAKFQKADAKEPSEFTADVKLAGIYSVAATDTLEIPLRGVPRPPTRFLGPDSVQILLLLECEWEDVFGQRTTDKGVFALLLSEWPDAPFHLPTYHGYLVIMDNERLRREATGQWKAKD